METRRALASIDELTTVKAEAWAWYQRGSGSDGRPVHEYDLTPASRAPTPSRYKLEAMKEAQEQEAMDGSKSNSPSPTPSLSHSDSSLFDMYEIERISQQLDYYIKASQAEYYGRYFSGDRRTVPLSESEMSGIKGKEKKKKTNRFWLRHAVTCGSRDDVVDSIGFGGPRSPGKHVPRLPEKHVPVVRLDNCRPRATHA